MYQTKAKKNTQPGPAAAARFPVLNTSECILTENNCIKIKNVDQFHHKFILICSSNQFSLNKSGFSKLMLDLYATSRSLKFPAH